MNTEQKHTSLLQSFCPPSPRFINVQETFTSRKEVLPNKKSTTYCVEKADSAGVLVRGKVVVDFGLLLRYLHFPSWQ